MTRSILHGGGCLARRHRVPRVLALASLFLSLVSIRASAQGLAPSLRIEECSLFDGTLRGRCGSYRVYEDRQMRTGRQIDLNLVIVPAESAAPHPDPVLILAGGPGQAATDLLPMVELLAAVNRDRDMIFVDQRGTGASNPLGCPNLGEGMIEYGPSGDAFWEACLSALQEHADLRHYTTPAAVDDFDEVRAALGYERVNLIGGSYGTRVAQVYLDRHPEHVRSAVLWAVAPIGYDIPIAGGLAVQHALEQLLDDCRSDAACGAAFPRLDTQLDSLIAALEAEPLEIGLPGGGGETRVTMSRDLFVQTLLALLFDASHMRMLPALLDRAADGDWNVLASIAAQVIEGEKEDPDALYLSVLCNEDMPGMRQERLAEFRGSFGAVLRESAEGLIHRCTRWPVTEAPFTLRAPADSSAPVLLLSGAADPATPPDGGEQALRYLANARHIEVPASSHGPIFPSCVRDLVADFIALPEPDWLDASCADEIRWAPFTVPGTRGNSQ